MNNWLKKIEKAGGKVLNPELLHDDFEFGPMQFDSRKLVAGETFVALKDARDGHEFIGKALNAGATAIIVQQESWNALYAQEQDHFLRELVVVEFEDSTLGMAEMGLLWRKKYSVPLFAVTGSNGKTSTKDILGGLMKELCYQEVLVSESSFNNHIGVPLTLSRLNDQTEAAVMEFGTNHFGELAYLAKYAKPNAAVITNIGESHLEFLKDKKGVLKAKRELFDGVTGKNPMWFVNLDDPMLAPLMDDKNDRVQKVSFSIKNKSADYFAEQVEELGVEANFGSKLLFSGKKLDKEFSADLKIPGQHNLQNALAAFAIAIEFFDKDPAEVAKALSNVKLSNQRSEVIPYGESFIFNDSYNANPTSMNVALKMIASKSRGEFCVALGEMKEVGDAAAQKHFELGRLAVRMGAKIVTASGNFAKDICKGAQAAGLKSEQTISRTEPEKLAEFLSPHLAKASFLLVKGSRGAKMERLVDRLLQDEEK